MNRLSPLISRASSSYAPVTEWVPASPPEARSEWADDLKLFVTGWLGGLIFFGTLLA